MDGILAYVKNIANLLIFVSFVMLILPTEKYKKYINLIMGIAIIAMVIGPVKSLVTKGNYNSDLVMEGIDISFNKAISNEEYEYYEKEQMELIMDTYRSNLNSQLDNIIKNKGYNLLDSQININLENDRFGEIDEIYMNISKDIDKEKNEAVSAIKIEKIEVGPKISTKEAFHTDFKAQEEEGAIKNLKIYISSFYNLSVDNIYITVK